MTLTVMFEDGRGERIPDREDGIAILREAEALGYGDLVELLRRALRNPSFELVVNSENARQFARALDHVRSAMPRDYETVDEDRRPLLDVRDAVLRRYATPPLTYQLRSWELEPEAKFSSYTGAYEKGGRLVRADGSAWRVLDVLKPATPLDDGVLFVESWRD